MDSNRIHKKSLRNLKSDQDFRDDRNEFPKHLYLCNEIYM